MYSMNLCKALFVTHEGFANSIFRSQVIEHCESMQKYNVSFDVLTFETFKSQLSSSQKNLTDYQKTGSVSVYLRKAVNMYLPGSTLVNSLLLFHHLVKLGRNNEYQFIHARADYTAFLCTLLKPLHKLDVVWDCRGDSVDELRFSISKFPRIVRTLMYVLLMPRQQFFRLFACRFSWKQVFVSKELEKVALPHSVDKSPSIIPCPVPTNRFFFL